MSSWPTSAGYTSTFEVGLAKEQAILDVRTQKEEGLILHFHYSVNTICEHLILFLLMLAINRSFIASLLVLLLLASIVATHEPVLPSETFI